MSDAFTLTRTALEARLTQEAANIEARELRELADRTLTASFYDDNDKFKPVRFVDHLLENYPRGSFVTPMNDQGGDVVWRYDEARGIFVNDGVPFIEKALKTILGEDTTTAQYSHVVKHLQVSTYTEPHDFEEFPEIVVLKNGSFNLYTGELLPHSPEYKAKNALPVNYEPVAECPQFLKFLDRVIPDEEYREFFREWLGYHLLKDYRFQRVVVLQGDGDNGKSTLLAAMVSFLGPNNITSQNLYRLSTNRFSPAELHGKLANISADIGPDELKYTGTIKMLSGNDYITVERKNRDPFQFTNYAKLTFSCNQLPKTPDETLAFYKRFIVIVTGDPIPKEEQNSQIIDEITTPEELSGIFNWAYQGLQNALDRGTLSEPTDIEERRELYQKMSDPVTGFINDHISEEPQAFEVKQDLVNAFFNYCKNKGFVPISNKRFFEDFKKTVWVREPRPTLYSEEHPQGKQTPCYQGVKLIGCKRSTVYETREEYIDNVSNKWDNCRDSRDCRGLQTRLEKGGLIN